MQQPYVMTTRLDGATAHVTWGPAPGVDEDVLEFDPPEVAAPVVDDGQDVCEEQP